MSHSTEIDEDRVYRAHVAEKARVAADRALLALVVPYVLARAARCMVPSCGAVATWRQHMTAPGAAGNPREDLLCDAHRMPPGVYTVREVPGAEVLRAAVRWTHGG